MRKMSLCHFQMLVLVGLFLFSPEVTLAVKPIASPGYPDLVAVKGGKPGEMFEVGIEALGGMQRFVKKGQTVLVKPNIGWARKPEYAASTNPEVVGKIVELAYKAGAKEVWVFDHAVHEEDSAHRVSGIKPAVEKYKGKMYSGDNKKDYRPVKIPKGKILKEALVHKLYLDADVVINVPVLKDHGATTMTSALKNLMGVVWDRRYWHRAGLNQCIADFPLSRKPDLTVIDAYRVMMRRGPQGVSLKDVVLKEMQIISPDILLADTAASKVLGVEPSSLQSLILAKAHGYGSMDLEKSNVKRIDLKKSK